ncbi:MAG: DUF6106 family protein [Lachnospiraceae bacterium]|nr:DUF6106 family protein [Lachnospiraceae bacterium]
MNQDMYVEWLVKRKDPAYAWPARIGLGILCAVSLVLSLVTVWGVLVLLAAIAGTFFLLQNLKVEYEYLYIDGGISIDKILGQSRRKKVVECSKEELIVVAPSDSYMLKDYETQNMKVIDCSSGQKEVKTHAMIFQKAGQHTKVIFEPNDKMLHAIRYNAPRKVIL